MDVISVDPTPLNSQGEGWGDTFTAVLGNGVSTDASNNPYGHFCVTRTDEESGWGQKLELMVTASPQAVFNHKAHLIEGLHATFASATLALLFSWLLSRLCRGYEGCPANPDAAGSRQSCSTKVRVQSPSSPSSA